jgi:large subunit ribosomal protein L1
MPNHGKRYNEAVKLLEADKLYPPDEGVSLAKSASTVKFDETVELHMRMGLDPRHADQQVRGVVLLPHGLGKPVRVLVFAQGEGVRMAEEAGADFVGEDELVKKVEGGWTDFDVAIATPEMMGRIGRLGRVLGRKGLMPNPRSGTVVQMADIGKAVLDARKGRVEFRLDRTAIIHAPIGKVSFEEQQLLDNMATLVDAVVKAKPAGAKGQYLRSLTVTTTMGPGIPIDLSPALSMASDAT